MSINEQRQISEWGVNVLDVTDDLILTHNFNGPRVELSLSEELIVELIVGYGHDAIKWCHDSLELLAKYEKGVQTSVNPHIKILTPGEKRTLDRLKALVDLKT